MNQREENSPLKNIGAWIKASRLPAQAFMFPSLLLGQMIYTTMYGDFTWGKFILIHLYGLFMHFFIVYANDYADYRTDQLNNTFTPFTGGSRVLVDGILTRKSLWIAGVLMAALCTLIGVGFSLQAGSFVPVILVLIGLFLLYAYSFPPFKISYRGCGETLQMIGVGTILPLFGYVAQGGNIGVFPWIFILMILPSQMAMAISTSLPDEPSDKLSQKKTTVVLLGAKKAKGTMIFFYILSVVIFIMSGRFEVGALKSVGFLLMMGILIFSQMAIALFSEGKPGSKSLFFLVALSILTNTLFVLGISALLL
jgi:1,4-dihydroxy-2-naphthoate polyprenyltransferase